MNKVKTLLVTLPVTLLVAGVIALPVYAHDGEPGTVAEPTSSQQGSDGRKKEDRDRTKTEAERGVEVEKAEDSYRNRGKEIVSELKAERQQKTALKAEDRQKRCENRKQGLQKKVDNLASNAQKHQSRITEIFNKATTYQAENNITLDGFDALVSTANAAKGTSQTSVDALVALKPTLDCTKESVPTDVATFKAAATQARTDLKAYKTSVKAVLKALNDAKER